MTTKELAFATMIVSKDTKTFTKNHLEQSKRFIDPKNYPELYNNDSNQIIYKNIKFIDRRLVDINSFELKRPELKDAKSTNAGSSQTARLFGEGINKDEVWTSLDKGYILSKVPPSVFRVNGEDYLCNGRTRHGKLLEQGKTNLIVDYYEADTWDEFDFFAIMSNRASEPESPHTMMDVKHYCATALAEGDLDLEWDAIAKRVEQIVDGTFSVKKKARMVSDIYHGDNLSENFVAYNEKESQNFLTLNGYKDNINNNGIYYQILSSDFHGKALVSSAKYYDKLIQNKKKVEELRIIIQTGLLEGEEPIECWKTRIDRFRNKWTILKNQMRNAWFTSSAKERNVITLYGATPACKELSKYFPMNKAVLFDKGILKDHLFDDLDENMNPKTKF